MVMDADTVVDPRAVVVVAFHATLADWTVLRAWRDENFAVRA